MIVVASSLFLSQRFARERFANSFTLDGLLRAALAEFLSTDDMHIELAEPVMVDGAGRRLTPDAEVLGTPSLAFRVFAEGTPAYANTVTLLREAHRPEQIARFEALVRPRLHGLGLNASTAVVALGFGQPPTCPCPGRAGRDRSCGLTRCVRCETNEIGGELGICAVCGDGERPAGNQCVPCSPDSAGTYGTCTRCPSGQRPNMGRTDCEEGSLPGVATAAAGSMSVVSLCLSGVILCVFLRWRRAQHSKSKDLGVEAEELADMIGAAVVAASPSLGESHWHTPSDQPGLGERIRPRALEFPTDSSSCSESEEADVADGPRRTTQFAELRPSGVESPRGTVRPALLLPELPRSPRPLAVEPFAWNSAVDLDVCQRELPIAPPAGVVQPQSSRNSRSPRSPASGSAVDHRFRPSAEELENTVPEPPHASAHIPMGAVLLSLGHSRTLRSPCSPCSPRPAISDCSAWQLSPELQISPPEPPRASIRARAGGCVTLHRGACTVTATHSPRV